jgi:hypothetical protein
MRRLNRILILLVFSLTVGLFCSEVPELLSQSDDPSNDFVTLAGPSHVRTVHDFRAGASSRRDAPSADVLLILPAAYHPASIIGPDLLRLLSVQRE